MATTVGTQASMMPWGLSGRRCLALPRLNAPWTTTFFLRRLADGTKCAFRVFVEGLDSLQDASFPVHGLYEAGIYVAGRFLVYK